MTERRRKKHSCERGKKCVKSSKWNSAYSSQSCCPTLNSEFSTISPSETKISRTSCGHSCIPTYFLTGQIVCHRAVVHSCTQARLWQRNKWLCCSLWTTETFRRGRGEQDMGHSRVTYTFWKTQISHIENIGGGELPDYKDCNLCLFSYGQICLFFKLMNQLLVQSIYYKK